LGAVRSAETENAGALQKALFEDEANHNLEAAMQSYQAVISHFDDERKSVATAVFRLGECYRKQGKTAEASKQYERIVREFSDQTELVQSSRAALGPESPQPSPTSPVGAAVSRAVVYLTGPVSHSGPLEMPADGPLTLSRAILRAGGFTNFANPTKVKLVRKGTPPAFYDVQKILNGEGGDDPELKPDDLIIVSEKFLNFGSNDNSQTKINTGQIS
jgi:tetratricopeptide (TPR) repeat protein